MLSTRLNLRRTSRSKGFFLLLIALYALVAPTVFAGASLCIGTDGHVELESNTSDCCAKDAFDRVEAQGEVASESCEVCLDIPLAGAAPSASFPTSISPAPGILAVGPVTLLPTFVFKASPLNTTSSIDPLIVHLRTTLLLI